MAATWFSTFSENQLPTQAGATNARFRSIRRGVIEVVVHAVDLSFLMDGADEQSPGR
jgi:hypothetical protein